MSDPLVLALLDACESAKAKSKSAPTRRERRRAERELRECALMLTRIHTTR